MPLTPLSDPAVLALPLAAIVRTSSMGERKAGSETFHADEEQVEAIDRYARKLNREYVLLPPELDVKGSWPIARRPSLRAGIEGVENGTYGGLIFANLKRATRARDGYLIWERVEKAGGIVYIAREQIDTSEPWGRKQRDYAIADAVEEREEHAVRYANRREKTVKAGIWRQKRTPTGLDFVGPADHDGKFRGSARRLRPGARAGEVLAAFEAADEGKPMAHIAQQLGMSTNGARQLLQNRTYLGELRDGGVPIKDADGNVTGRTPLYVNLNAHDPLPGLTVELFERVRRRLDATRRGPRPPRALTADRPRRIAEGLVICAACSHAMPPVPDGKRRPETRPYKCRGRSAAGPCPAPASIAGYKLDAYIDRLVRWEVAWLQTHGKRDPRKQLAAAEAERDRLIAKRKGAVARLVAGGVGEDDPDAVEPLAEIDAAIAAAKDRVADIDRTVRTAASFADGSRAIETPEDLRQAALDLIGRIVVRRAGGRGARAAVGDRVVVVRKDADLGLSGRRRGEAWPIEPVDLSRLKRPDVLGPFPGEQPA